VAYAPQPASAQPAPSPVPATASSAPVFEGLVFHALRLLLAALLGQEYEGVGSSRSDCHCNHAGEEYQETQK
jgi:hypothetical protein